MTNTYPKDGPTRAVRRFLGGVLFAIAALASVPPAAEAQGTVIFGQVQNTQSDGTTICLGSDGLPAAGKRVIAVYCNQLAPVWSLVNWTAPGKYKLAIGQDGPGTHDNEALCLDVDTAHPANYEHLQFYYCHPSAATNTDWEWGTPGTQSLPSGTIVLPSQGKCVVNAQIGVALDVGPCNPSTQTWFMQTAPTLSDFEGPVGLHVPGQEAVCLGVDGSTASNADVISVDCASAPSWKVNQWARSAPLTKLELLNVDGTGTGYCMTDYSGRPGEQDDTFKLQTCDSFTRRHHQFYWTSGNALPGVPLGPISLGTTGKCLTATPEGDRPFLSACDKLNQIWVLLPSLPTTQQAGSQLFTTSGTFTPPVDGTYRIVAIGGGGGGGADEGAGGGSGVVAYSGSVTLSTSDQITVTVGTGGVAGVVTGTLPQQNGGAGTVSSFGPYTSGGNSTTLTADGGSGGGKNRTAGGAGGSGGGFAGKSGGRAGGDGGSGGGTGQPGGTGQGASFHDDLCKFVTVNVYPGIGGSYAVLTAFGGGGGGGLAMDDPNGQQPGTPAGGDNAKGTGYGGVGYGAGGGGGDGHPVGATNPLRNGGAGAAGAVLVEWGGDPDANCPDQQRFRSSGTFTASYTGTHRILAIGAGGEGGDTQGGGGGSGETAYTAVDLAAGDQLAVTVGSIGEVATGSTVTQNGTTLVSADGGAAGANNGGAGGNGGSGGGQSPHSGGMNGYGGGGPNGGTGQPDFPQDLCKIIHQGVYSGAGGYSTGRNTGGGGGGGVVVVAAGETNLRSNGNDTANSGNGFGSGGAGGDGSAGVSPDKQYGGPGISGIVIIQWGGTVPAGC